MLKDKFATTQPRNHVPTLAPELGSYDKIWADPAFIVPPNPYIMDQSHLSKKEDCDVRISDVASGNGRYALPFAKAGYGEVVAVELSSVGCDSIRAAGSGHHNLTVNQGDILTLDTKNRYDIVVCSGLLEELSYDEDALRLAIDNLQKLTDDGGRIVLKYCLYISTCNPQHMIEDDFVRPLFTDDEWDVVSLETDENPRYYKNASGDDSYLRTQTLVADRLELP